MFVDELKIYAKAGDGGDGVVRWRHEKFKPMAGPSGGNGGRGGHVYVRAVKDLNRLAKYTGNNRFIAASGQDGGNDSREGFNGEDLYIDVPVGSRVTDLQRRRVFDVTEVGEEQLILKGGGGGLGNEHFKSSTNRAPEEFTTGNPGEEGEFLIEVMLMVDIGLVGLPNAGKSTLLNTLTNAKSKIADYPFTTLEPHLGALYGHTIADIPGLIAGAATGKGLGYKFLRHVSRTKMLLHLVSLESVNPLSDYQTIRQELEKYDNSLTEKEEWLILTKTDLVDQSKIDSIKKDFLDLGKEKIFSISYKDEIAIKELRDSIVQRLGSSNMQSV